MKLMLNNSQVSIFEAFLEKVLDHIDNLLESKNKDGIPQSTFNILFASVNLPRSDFEAQTYLKYCNQNERKLLKGINVISHITYAEKDQFPLIQYISDPRLSMFQQTKEQYLDIVTIEFQRRVLDYLNCKQEEMRATQDISVLRCS